VFKEDRESVEADIAELREWILGTPHLQNVRHDDSFLKLFLRGTNYSVNQAKDKLDLFFSVRSVLPCWFEAWDPSESSTQTVLRAGIFLPLQGYDKMGRYCFLIRLGQLTPREMTAENCFKVFIMIFNLILEGNTQATTKGLCFIVDMEGMTASHATMIGPSLLKKLVMVFLEAFPMDNDILTELTRLYFLNMPKVLEKLFSIFLSFLNKKLRKTVKLQDKMSQDMQDELGKEILPGEYGGSNRTFQELTEFWLEEMDRQTEWLGEQCRYKSEESLRVGKSKLNNMLSCSLM